MPDHFIDDINNCIKVLKEGGLILYPTDTIWGIGCDATNPEAIEKIYKLKNRPDNKALILLCENERMIRNYITDPPQNIFEYLQKVHKPTTVIYNNPIGLPPNLVKEGNTIAIRIPDDSFCKELLKVFEKPIISTSANISGTESPLDYRHVSIEIKNGVDYIVQHRRSDNISQTPSTIIQLGSDGNINTIRP